MDDRKMDSIKNYNTSQFKSDLNSIGINLTENQINEFLIYYEMLTEWNQVMNLTAITEYSAVMKKHFVDSLSLVRACDMKKPTTVIDVGTGAGFPGLALKIAFPDLEIILLDSVNKKIQFLDAVIEKLKLQGVHTLHGRAEDFAKSGMFRSRYDLCVSRAVANLSTLSEYCLPFLKVGGLFISYKSEKISAEIRDAGKAVSLLGGRMKEQVEFCLPDSDICRNLVVIEKVKETPEKFPRKAGLPAREPL